MFYVFGIKYGLGRKLSSSVLDISPGMTCKVF